MGRDYGDVGGGRPGVGDGRVVLYGEFEDGFLGVCGGCVWIFTDVLGGEGVGGDVEVVR